MSLFFATIGAVALLTLSQMGGCYTQLYKPESREQRMAAQSADTVAFADSARDSADDIVSLVIHYVMQRHQPSRDLRYRPIWIVVPDSIQVDEEQLESYGNDVLLWRRAGRPQQGWPISVSGPERTGDNDVRIEVSEGRAMAVTITEYRLQRKDGYWHITRREIIGHS